MEGKPLPQEFEFAKDVLDALLTKKGTKHTELKLALSADLKPVDWFASSVWVRTIVDLLILDEEAGTAWVVDYKTGNNKYPDRDQIEIMSLVTLAHYPTVKRVYAALVFVLKDDMVKGKTSIEQAEAIWWNYRERVAKISDSHDSNQWPPKQGPLCGWCPVTDCEFNPKR